MVRGQIHGGGSRGMGQALPEHQFCDRQSGQLLSGSFMDYGMPRADTMPDVQAELEEVPCKTNPLGVNGIGENRTLRAAPAAIERLTCATPTPGVPRLAQPGSAAGG